MTNEFKIEVPINVKGKEGGRNIGKEIGEQVKKSLKSIGIGRTGGGGIAGGIGAKTGLKALGVIGAILGVLESLEFILKPILSLLKVGLMLLLMPLIPILKPVLIGLAKFIKWFQPIMFKITGWIQRIVEFFSGAFGQKVLALLGFKGLFKKLQVGWELLASAGMWIWNNILLPGFMYLKDIGRGIWELMKSFFKGSISVAVEVWEYVKSFFKGTLSVGTTVWNWFKSLFTGTVGKIGGFFGFAKGGTVPGPIGAPQLAVVHGGEQVIPVGGRSGVVININNPSVRNDGDIKLLANEVSKVLQRQMTGRIAQ